MSLCRYLCAPSEAEVLTPAGWTQAAPIRSLCAWGQFHPAAPEALAKVPPFVARTALGGHAVQPDKDCPRCAYFAAGPPVE